MQLICFVLYIFFVSNLFSAIEDNYNSYKSLLPKKPSTSIISTTSEQQVNLFHQNLNFIKTQQISSINREGAEKEITPKNLGEVIAGDLGGASKACIEGVKKNPGTVFGISTVSGVLSATATWLFWAPDPSFTSQSVAGVIAAAGAVGSAAGGIAGSYAVLSKEEFEDAWKTGHNKAIEGYRFLGKKLETYERLHREYKLNNSFNFVLDNMEKIKI